MKDLIILTTMIVVDCCSYCYYFCKLTEAFHSLHDAKTNIQESEYTLGIF